MSFCRVCCVGMCDEYCVGMWRVTVLYEKSWNLGEKNVRIGVVEKSCAFEVWSQWKDELLYERYKEKKNRA